MGHRLICSCSQTFEQYSTSTQKEVIQGLGYKAVNRLQALQKETQTSTLDIDVYDLLEPFEYCHITKATYMDKCTVPEVQKVKDWLTALPSISEAEVSLILNRINAALQWGIKEEHDSLSDVARRLTEIATAKPTQEPLYQSNVH